MDTKVNYQYSYFIYPYFLRNIEYKEYINNLLNNKKYKLKIFEKSKVSCINLESDCIDKILSTAKESKTKIVTFSTKDENADVYGYNICKNGLNTVFNVKGKDFDFGVELTIPGLFNVENALAAIAIATSLNIEQKYIYL